MIRWLGARLVLQAVCGASCWLACLALGVDISDGTGFPYGDKIWPLTPRYRVVWALWRRHQGAIVAVRRIEGALRRRGRL